MSVYSFKPAQGGLLLAFVVTTVAAAQPATDATAVAKKSQNPVSDMISVPIQYNTFFNAGPDERTQHLINVQPVVPLGLGADWHLILRAIVPISSVPTVVDERETGLGDINIQPFFSPKKAGPVTWGVGPGVMVPSATDSALGTGKWAAGPVAVVLVMPGSWVIGALAQNVWSFAGAGQRADVNMLTLQPFVNYNIANGWAVASTPILTANWEAGAEDRWTVPLGGGVSKTGKVGPQAFSVGASAFYNIARPTLAPDFQSRIQLSLLFP